MKISGELDFIANTLHYTITHPMLLFAQQNAPYYCRFMKRRAFAAAVFILCAHLPLARVAAAAGVGEEELARHCRFIDS